MALNKLIMSVGTRLGMWSLPPLNSMYYSHLVTWEEVAIENKTEENDINKCILCRKREKDINMENRWLHSATPSRLPEFKKKNNNKKQQCVQITRIGS